MSMSMIKKNRLIVMLCIQNKAGKQFCLHFLAGLTSVFCRYLSFTVEMPGLKIHK